MTVSPPPQHAGATEEVIKVKPSPVSAAVILAKEKGQSTPGKVSDLSSGTERDRGWLEGQKC